MDTSTVDRQERRTRWPKSSTGLLFCLGQCNILLRTPRSTQSVARWRLKAPAFMYYEGAYPMATLVNSNIETINRLLWSFIQSIVHGTWCNPPKESTCFPSYLHNGCPQLDQAANDRSWSSPWSRRFDRRPTRRPSMKSWLGFSQLLWLACSLV